MAVPLRGLVLKHKPLRVVPMFVKCHAPDARPGSPLKPWAECPHCGAVDYLSPDTTSLPTNDSPEAALAALLSLPEEWRVACSKPWSCDIDYESVDVSVGELSVVWWPGDERWAVIPRHSDERLCEGHAPTLWQAVADALKAVRQDG